MSTGVWRWPKPHQQQPGPIEVFGGAGGAGGEGGVHERECGVVECASSGLILRSLTDKCAGPRLAFGVNETRNELPTGTPSLGLQAPSRVLSKRKLIGLGLLLALAVIGARLLSVPSRMQVVGTIAPDDLAEIRRLVRHELRHWMLPKVEWDNLFYPRYVISSVMEYRAQRLLWAEAHDDGSVDVFAGVSKDVIRDEGHVVSLRKTPKWTITGYAYWASSEVAPPGIHVPPP